jgi:hypothetical protein
MRSQSAYLVISAARRPARVITIVCGLPLVSEAVESTEPFLGLCDLRKDGIFSKLRFPCHDEVSRKEYSKEQSDRDKDE